MQTPELTAKTSVNWRWYPEMRPAAPEVVCGSRARDAPVANQCRVNEVLDWAGSYGFRVSPGAAVRHVSVVHPGGPRGRTPYVAAASSVSRCAHLTCSPGLRHPACCRANSMAVREPAPASPAGWEGPRPRSPASPSLIPPAPRSAGRPRTVKTSDVAILNGEFDGPPIPAVTARQTGQQLGHGNGSARRCAGINRHGGGDGRALHRRSSEPR